MSKRPEKEFSPYPGNESVYGYCKGGYHPVDINDLIKNCYLVHNKLAYASSCMVWLVEDLLLKRFVSLKILSADSSAKSSEKHVVAHLKVQQGQYDTHPGKEHVMQVYDAFTILGPNGSHICIVAELLGINLLEEMDAFGTLSRGSTHFFPQRVYKKMAGQVALGLAYLHKCGIIHGDLHFGNILFYPPEIQKASHEEIKGLFGEPIPLRILYMDDSPVPPSEHRPRYIYMAKFSERLLKLCISPSDRIIHVKICDFGESTISNQRRNIAMPIRFHMPLIFRAPEVIFNDIRAPTFSMDIWSLGVVLYMIMNRKIEPFDEGEVLSMVIHLGKLPEKWWNKWTERVQYFNENGVGHKSGMKAGELWDKKWVRFVPEEESTAFSDMLWKIFRYDPEERIDADEVVRLIPDSWKQVEATELTSSGGRLIRLYIGPDNTPMISITENGQTHSRPIPHDKLPPHLQSSTRTSPYTPTK